MAKKQIEIELDEIKNSRLPEYVNYAPIAQQSGIIDQGWVCPFIVKNLTDQLWYGGLAYPSHNEQGVVFVGLMGLNVGNMSENQLKTAHRHNENRIREAVALKFQQFFVDQANQTTANIPASTS